eukprot:TRINITY_DN54269_c0_g1_i1.p1 TRINITY_DN54269_c0_g1~~TRINITY_DN54269_c0_g1_i1.p1  ORF type:complete len:459 (+),score=102.15 TRINITY_DN54269_c0_g1_i1:73-1449(+)
MGCRCCRCRKPKTVDADVQTQAPPTCEAAGTQTEHLGKAHGSTQTDVPTEEPKAAVPVAAVMGPTVRTESIPAAIQTDPVVATLVDSVPGAGSSNAEVQTDPMVQVELTPGRQLPLDIVLCLDSSCSMGEVGFNKARQFFQRLLTYFEWPATHCAALMFSHHSQVLCKLHGDPWQADSALRKASYVPGETKYAPMLKAAHKMLLGEESRPGVQRVVLVASDTDRPNDFHDDSIPGIQEQLEADGIQLLCILSQKHSGDDVVKKLVYPSYEESRQMWPIHRASNVPACFVSCFDILCYQNDEGDAMLDGLLQHLVLTPRVVTRAKVRWPLEPPFVEVEDIFELEEGEHEMLLGTQPAVEEVKAHRGKHLLQYLEIQEHEAEAMAARTTYPCWDAAVYCGHNGAERAHLVAQRDKNWYLRTVYANDVPMYPKQDLCIPDLEACNPQQKTRPVKPAFELLS